MLSKYILPLVGNFSFINPASEDGSVGGSVGNCVGTVVGLCVGVSENIQWKLAFSVVGLKVITTANVLFSINAGIFNTGTGKPECLLIINRKVLVDQKETYIHTSPKDGGDKRYELYILGIDKDGDLHIFEPGTGAKEILDTGCVDAVMGFVPLIIDYNTIDVDERCSYISYEKHPRQIIGIDKDNNYFVLTVNDPGMSLKETRNLLKSMNVKLAYNLDGGSSTQTVFYKENITPIYREETGRKIPTVINFEVITGDLIID